MISCPVNSTTSTKADPPTYSKKVGYEIIVYTKKPHYFSKTTLEL